MFFGLTSTHRLAPLRNLLYLSREGRNPGEGRSAAAQLSLAGVVALLRGAEELFEAPEGARELRRLRRRRREGDREHLRAPSDPRREGVRGGEPRTELAPRGELDHHGRLGDALRRPLAARGARGSERVARGDEAAAARTGGQKAVDLHGGCVSGVRGFRLTTRAPWFKTSSSPSFRTMRSY